MKNELRTFIDTFEEYLCEEYLKENDANSLTEGPFDLFKKKALTPEQDAYAKALRAGMDKAQFVSADYRAGLEKTFFNTIGSLQHQAHRLWTNCYLVVCPMLEEDGATLSKASGAAAGSFSNAIDKATDLAMTNYNSGKVKAYKKVFGDLSMPIVFCVKPDEVVSPEFGKYLQGCANLPKMQDLGTAFGTSLADAIIIGAYDMGAKEGKEFIMPVRIRELFCNGLGELVNLEGVARDPKTGEAVKK